MIAYVAFLLMIGLPLWGFYRLVVEGVPGKPSLMELNEAAMERHRLKEEERAIQSFENLSRRYRGGEISWQTLEETMWLAHPYEMEKWKEKWQRHEATRH